MSLSELPQKLHAGKTLDDQQCFVELACLRFCCKHYNLVLIGLLYKAYPDGCQQVLLRLRPYCPLTGASALMTASVIAQVPLWVACTTWWEQTIAKQMITSPGG